MAKTQKEIKEEKTFRQEFKKSLSTAIVAAFSLLAALTWSDVIKDYLNEITSISILQGKIVVAVIVTFLAALAVYIASKLGP